MPEHDQTVRVESDSLGDVAVPADRYWGAQTQRSLQHFAISNETMPWPLIVALSDIKAAAAASNAELGRLPREKAEAIVAAAREVTDGKLNGEFPLSVW